MDTYCKECHKILIPIKNDWKKRTLHKSCWLKKNERENLLDAIKLIMESEKYR